jgi:hypothetical protein
MRIFVKNYSEMGKSERKREQRVALGKYFYDISKLTFAALVLGAVLLFFQADALEAPVAGMFASGAIVSLLFAAVGNKLNR